MSLRILPAGAIPAGVHHTFDQATLAGVSTALDALDEAAATEFEFDLDFGTTGTRLTRVELTMRITLAMPVWSKADQASRAERDEWGRFLRALRVHEDGHVAICRREAPTTYARLLQATPATINTVLAAEEARIIRLNETYDHTTDHGRTQQTPHGTTTITLPASTP